MGAFVYDSWQLVKEFGIGVFREAGVPELVVLVFAAGVALTTLFWLPEIVDSQNFAKAHSTHLQC